MSEMVERVAKAMWDRTHDGNWEDRGDGQDESRDIHLEDAHVAIAAMREPTGEMRDAGAGVYETSAGQPSRTWHAMIDEALK